MKFFKNFFGARAPVQKGSISPFNRLIDVSGMSGKKLKEPYRNSVWVQRAIKLVSLPISEVPLRFSTEGRGVKQVLTDPELLGWWESPAIGPDKQPLSMSDTIEATVGWLKLTGSAYWILDDRWLVPNNAMPFPEAGRFWSRFIIARPDSMAPVKDREDGSLLGWEYTDAGHRKHNFAIEQVVQHRLWNPYDDYAGMAEMDSAMISAEADYLAGTYKLNLWQNNGDRGPIIGLPGGVMLTDEQRKQFLSQLREKKELAARGIFKAAFIDQDIKVEDPKVQAVDAAFVASRAEDPLQIAIAFGVPPSMFTVAASYSVGSASDRYRLIEDTSSPTAKKISEGIERVAKLQMGRSVYAWFDFSKHSVFQQIRTERIDGGTKLWDRGVPWSKISEWLSLDLPDFDGAEQGFLPFSVSPVGTDGVPDPMQDPALNETPPKDTTTDQTKKALAAAFERRSSSQARAQSREAARHLASRRPAMRRYENALGRELAKVRGEVIGKILASTLADVGRSALPATRAEIVAADFLFDLGKFTQGLQQAMRKAGAAALQDAGSQLFGELLRTDAFHMPPVKATEFLRDRENKLSDVPQNIFDRLKAQLTEGLEKGDTRNELADRIGAECNDISKGRARVIASTETAAAYGVARHEGMVQSGVTMKRWLTSGLSNVRPTHQTAGRDYSEGIPIDQPFRVGADLLMHPGDEDGSPEEVINCHCISIAVVAQGEET